MTNLTVPHVTPDSTCAITIGRLRALAGGDLTPITWDAKGDDVKLSGAIYAPGITDAWILRQQLLGYVDNFDEEVVPVTWGGDITVDGYYRVKSASVDMHGPSLYHGIFDVSVDLKRVTAYSGPLFESLLIGATLTNGLGITGAPWHALPQVATALSRTPSISDATGRSSADGQMELTFFSSYLVTPRYRLQPADYYKGAAAVEYSFAGANYQPVVGSQMLDDPYNWRLTNGCVRVTPQQDADAGLNVSHWDGTQWDTPKVFRIEAANRSATILSYTNVVVLRNSPEEVTLRLNFALSDFAQSHNTLDLTLRRGSIWVRCYIESELSCTWRIIRDTAEASTSYTGGIGASANDASGNRYQLVSATMTTKDTANGALTLPVAATTAGFGIGSEVGGSGAAYPNDLTGTRNIVEQYFAAQGEQMIVAGA